MTDTPLFAGYDPLGEPEPSLSPGRRLTQRQIALIAAGVHPLTKGRLHPLALRERDAGSPKHDPYTCGSCVHRQSLGYHNRAYPKCLRFGRDSSRVSHSAATDVRAWWPACEDYAPREDG